MLLALGRRPPSVELVDLLAECHTRIRTFLELGRRLAVAVAPPEGEIRSIAADVRRYFMEAFPLHLADEDVDIAPRLAGISPEIDAALAEMSADHLEHAPAVARLVELCVQLEREPSRHAELAPVLAGATSTLAAKLEPHLELEERTLFPAVRRLPAAERAAIREALRVRREHTSSRSRRGPTP